MNRAPHSFDISCSYRLGKNKTKKKLGVSKLEGYIILKDGKSHIRLPMRSFVRSFIDRMHDILAGENTDERVDLHTASSAAAGSLARITGILLGDGTTPSVVTDTDLESIVSSVSYGCEYKDHTFAAPYVLDGGALRTTVTRLITNASGNPWTIREVGLKTKNIASTASDEGILLVTHDTGLSEIFSAATDKQVQIAFQVGRSDSNGGAVLNLLRVFYNLFLSGDANYSAFVPRVGTVTVSHASASATSHLVVDGAAAKFWGVVVGVYDTTTVNQEPIDGFEGGGDDPGINPTVGPDDYNFDINVSDLTYGANTVTAVVISGKKVSFTVSRDITNGGTASVRINRIGLVTKGATAAPTVLVDDQIFLMINRSPQNINIAPAQTVRVEYKFEIQGD